MCNRLFVIAAALSRSGGRRASSETLNLRKTCVYGVWCAEPELHAERAGESEDGKEEKQHQAPDENCTTVYKWTST